MTNQTSKSATTAEKTITDTVLSRINEMMSVGALVLPSDYNPANALKAAYFTLLETKTSKNDGNRPVLDVCTKDSIANSLFYMVTNAWNPAKKQCYFIAYGTKLSCQGSYHGHKANAKRVGLKNCVPQVIYEGDIFEYEIDSASGHKRLIKHVQKIENINLAKIKAAYITVHMEDGTSYIDIMTMAQIEKAWEQGQGKGKTHINFTDMMCKKTIISRVCTEIINASDDSHLEVNEDEAPAIIEATHEEIDSEAGQQLLSFTEVPETITPEVIKPEVKEPVENEKTESKTKNAPGF